MARDPKIQRMKNQLNI